MPACPDRRINCFLCIHDVHGARRRRYKPFFRQPPGRFAIHLMVRTSVLREDASSAPAAPLGHAASRLASQNHRGCRHLAEVPEQAGHDAQRLFGHRRAECAHRARAASSRDRNAAPRSSAARARRKTRRWAASRRNSATPRAPCRWSAGSTSPAQLIQGLSRSVRDAAKLCVALTLTIAKPLPCECALNRVDDLVDLWCRRRSEVAARRWRLPGMALAGFSILPADIASTSSVFQA